MISWINRNKEWLFSGVGVTIIVGCISIFSGGKLEAFNFELDRATLVTKDGYLLNTPKELSIMYHSFDNKFNRNDFWEESIKQKG